MYEQYNLTKIKLSSFFLIIFFLLEKITTPRPQNLIFCVMVKDVRKLEKTHTHHFRSRQTYAGKAVSVDKQK